MNDQYEVVIGLEIHVQLKTQSKMFCRCNNDAQGAMPNQHTCPVCLGMPGTLPVPNRTAVEWALKTSMALGCEIPKLSKFDRKQYFYPDLPKGYQISQFDQPLGGPGTFEFDVIGADGKPETKSVRITRLHLEEDAGKLTHPKGADYSLVDLNRAGTPLMEIVTEPDLRSATDAKAFMQELRLLMRYLGVSDADMEKGHLRADANISVRKAGDTKHGTKTELKNLNSFKFVERGIEAEYERQVSLLKEGKAIAQETRGFDEQTGKTVSQRSKEEANDYRYFPEPDIPPLEPAGLDLKRLKAEILELPVAKSRRFIKEYGIRFEDARSLISNDKNADYFETRVKESITGESAINDGREAATIIAKMLTGPIASQLKSSEKDLFSNLEISPLAISDMAKGNAAGKLPWQGVKDLLAHDEVKDYKKYQNSVRDFYITASKMNIEGFVDKAIKDNPKPAADYKAGQENAIKVIIGWVMRLSKGGVDAKKVEDLIKKKLG